MARGGERKRGRFLSWACHLSPPTSCKSPGDTHTSDHQTHIKHTLNSFPNTPNISPKQNSNYLVKLEPIPLWIQGLNLATLIYFSLAAEKQTRRKVVLDRYLIF